MIKLKLFTIIFLITTPILIGQESELLDSIKLSFEENNYSKVISLSNVLLQKDNSLNERGLINIYLMRSVSYFALSKKDSAKICYIEILKIDENYEPDPVLVSPKVIKFFNPIKSDFHQIQNNNSNDLADNNVDESNKLSEVSNNIASSVVKNIVLPGWGHFNSSNTLKAIILTSVSSILLSSSVYYIVKTDDLYDKYLFETDPASIPVRYDSYNKYFKTRNIVLISYAAIWVYSILDVWLFSPGDFIQFDISQSSQYYGDQMANGLQLKLIINF